MHGSGFCVVPPDLGPQCPAIGWVLPLPLDMVFRRFNAVKNGVMGMAMGEPCFVRRQWIVHLVTVHGGSAVVLRRLLVVIGGYGMVFCTA